MWVVARATVALVLVAGALAVSVPEDAPSAPTWASPSLRSADAGAYSMVLSGAWVYDGMPAGEAVDGVRFEVGAPALVTRADGSRIHAFPVVTQAAATTLLPSSAGAPTWSTWNGIQWMDGHRVAIQSKGTGTAALTTGGVSADAAVWSYPPGPTGDCLLSAPGPCDLPSLRIRLGPTELQDLGMEDHGRAWLRHVRADDGHVRIDWWHAPGISVPIRFEASAPGVGGAPRSVALHLTGFLPGTGPAEPLASGFAAAPLQWLPRSQHGPDDHASASRLPLARAYDAALRDPDFADLREYLKRHDGYVFMAEPARGGQAWNIHLSDGRVGFSFSARLTAPLLPFGPERVELTRLEPHALAAAAPKRDQAPAEMPSVASMVERWKDHAPADVRRSGANVYAFRILAGPDAPIVHYAVGRAEEVRWGVAALEVLGSGGAQRSFALLELDGQGQALSYRQSDPTRPAAPAASPPYAPASLPYISPAAPSDAVAGIGLAAAAGAVLVLPKLFVALFTRFRPDELLEHPLRATLMDAVRAEPGLHFRALCERLGANPGQVRHHVRKLVQGGLLIERASPGYTCYFTHDGTSRTLLAAAPLLRARGARNLLACLAGSPGTNAKDLAFRAGLSPATATYHLKRLQEAGIVAAQRDGRSLRLHLTPDGHAAQAAMG